MRSATGDLSYRPLQQIFERLALAREPRSISVDDDLWRKESRIVVRGHRESVRTGIAERDQIADLRPIHSPRQRRAIPVAREHVSGFAEIARHDQFFAHLRFDEALPQRFRRASA